VTRCEVCGGAKRPLFTSWFCPKECDRPGVRVVSAVAFGGEVPAYTFFWKGAVWRAFKRRRRDALPKGTLVWEDPGHKLADPGSLVNSIVGLMGFSDEPGWPADRPPLHDYWMLRKV
jgi:hypothetical protein